MNVYLMLYDGKINGRDITLVSSVDDAKKMIEAEEYNSYEQVEVLSSNEVDGIADENAYYSIPIGIREEYCDKCEEFNCYSCEVYTEIKDSYRKPLFYIKDDKAYNKDCKKAYTIKELVYDINELIGNINYLHDEIDNLKVKLKAITKSSETYQTKYETEAQNYQDHLDSLMDTALEYFKDYPDLINDFLNDLGLLEQFEDLLEMILDD